VLSRSSPAEPSSPRRRRALGVAALPLVLERAAPRGRRDGRGAERRGLDDLVERLRQVRDLGPQVRDLALELVISVLQVMRAPSDDDARRLLGAGPALDGA